MTTRIGIDCRLAGKEHAGIGRYIAEFVPKIIKHRDVHWVLFFRNRSQFNELFSDQSLPSNVELVLTNVRHYSLAEQLLLPFIFGRHHLDLLHIPHFNLPIFYRGKFVLTIHDLLWHHHRGSRVTTLPAWQYWLKYGFYRLITRHAIKRASQIMVPSRAVAQTIVAIYPTVQHKIQVTYEGVASALTKFGKSRPLRKRDKHQLLYVGSLYPHKNVALILTALKLLPDKYHLKVVSARSVFADQFLKQVQQIRLTKRVEYVGAVDDRQLATIYQSTQALIQPSTSEGFGLTGIEALAFRTPVIASDIPVFREIYKEAALFFKPNQAQSLADQVMALEKRQLFHSQQAKAISVSQQYNWHKLVNQTWQTYQRVLNI